MNKGLVIIVSIFLLAGCASTGLVNPLPPVDSPETSSTIQLNNVFTSVSRVKNLTFTLDDVKIYNFGSTGSFSFHLNEGSYMFGYTYGSKKCETEVFIRPRANYVFNIGPECLIELESE
jgi:uncharacterized lipoprotein YajG